MKKLSEEHYIICDDSDIKIGDIVAERLLIGDYGFFTIHTQNDIDKTTQKVITHSTQPLEDINFVDEAEGKIIPKIKPLPLSEVKELLGVVDVEKKALEISPVELDEDDFDVNETHRVTWIDGYTQALEDNKEKKYTEEDMRKAMVLYSAWITGGAPSLRVAETAEQRIEQIIQSLQPKTEWEVEIVDGKLKLKS